MFKPEDCCADFAHN